MSRRKRREHMATFPDIEDVTPISRCCLCNTALDDCFLRGVARWRRSCPSMNRGHAGQCSANAPTVDASVRLSIIFDARFVAVFINGCDLAWVDDDEGPLPHLRKIKRSNPVNERGLVVRANLKLGI